jgi:hypothetical protein
MKIYLLIAALLFAISGVASAQTLSPWLQEQRADCLTKNAGLSKFMSVDKLCDCVSQNMQQANITDMAALTANQSAGQQIVKSCMQTAATGQSMQLPQNSQPTAQQLYAAKPMHIKWNAQFGAYQNNMFTGFTPLSASITDQPSIIALPTATCTLGQMHEEQRQVNGHPYIYQMRTLTCQDATAANVRGGLAETSCFRTPNGIEQNCANQFKLYRSDNSLLGIIVLNGTYVDI